MKDILVYLDSGVSLSAYRKLLEALHHGLRSAQYRLRSVNHRFFLSDHWEEEAALLVFPGGRDLPYHDRLRGEGNAKIQQYIKSGGRFLGICAGGYYASATIEFDRNGPLEVISERELAFFPGKAVGPAYREAPFSYGSESGSRTALIEWEGGVTSSYFNGGCLFEEPEKYPTVEVIARYHDLEESPAAIVLCQVSQGWALLSGIHPEYHPNFFWNYLLNKILI